MKFTGLAVETTPGTQPVLGGIAWCGHAHKSATAAQGCARKLLRRVEKEVGPRRSFNAVAKAAF